MNEIGLIVNYQTHRHYSKPYHTVQYNIILCHTKPYHQPEASEWGKPYTVMQVSGSDDTASIVRSCWVLYGSTWPGVGWNVPSIVPSPMVLFPRVPSQRVVRHYAWLTILLHAKIESICNSLNACIHTYIHTWIRGLVCSEGWVWLALLNLLLHFTCLP